MAFVVIDDDAFERQDHTLSVSFDRVIGQIFRLLPMREEGQDYIKPLNTLIVELSGYTWMFPDDNELSVLLGKLRGLKSNECEEDFKLFRRMIFEACNIAGDVKASLQKEG